MTECGNHAGLRIVPRHRQRGRHGCRHPFPSILLHALLAACGQLHFHSHCFAIYWFIFHVHACVCACAPTLHLFALWVMDCGNRAGKMSGPRLLLHHEGTVAAIFPSQCTQPALYMVWWLWKGREVQSVAL